MGFSAEASLVFSFFAYLGNFLSRPISGCLLLVVPRQMIIPKVRNSLFPGTHQPTRLHTLQDSLNE